MRVAPCSPHYPGLVRAAAVVSCLLPESACSQEGRGSGERSDWCHISVLVWPFIANQIMNQMQIPPVSQSVGSWPWFYLFSLTDLANLTAERDGVLNKWLEKSTHIELWQSSHAHQKSFSPEHVEGSQGASEQLAASHWEVTGETPGTLERERRHVSVGTLSQDPASGHSAHLASL